MLLELLVTHSFCVTEFLMCSFS